MVNNMDRLTTVRIANGQFNVYFDGRKTEWSITNGSLGLSGKGRNMYGVTKPGFIKWIGPLASCKSLLADKLAKESK